MSPDGYNLSRASYGVPRRHKHHRMAKGAEGWLADWSQRKKCFKISLCALDDWICVYVCACVRWSGLWFVFNTLCQRVKTICYMAVTDAASALCWRVSALRGWPLVADGGVGCRILAVSVNLRVASSPHFLLSPQPSLQLRESVKR